MSTMAASAPGPGQAVPLAGNGSKPAIRDTPGTPNAFAAILGRVTTPPATLPNAAEGRTCDKANPGLASAIAAALAGVGSVAAKGDNSMGDGNMGDGKGRSSHPVKHGTNKAEALPDAVLEAPPDMIQIPAPLPPTPIQTIADPSSGQANAQITQQATGESARAIGKTPMPVPAHAVIDKPELAETPDSSVASVSTQETHFPPVQSLSLATQIVDAVNDRLGPVPAAPVTEPAIVPQRPVQSLSLQLDPPHLGSVEIRIHLAGAALRVHLTVQTAESTALVSRDRDVLVEALKSSGYSVEGLVVRQAEPSASTGLDGGTNQQDAQQDQRQARDRDQDHAASEGSRQNDGRESDRRERRARPLLPAAMSGSFQSGGSRSGGYV